MPKLSDTLRRPSSIREDGPTIPLSEIAHRINMEGEGHFSPPANVNLRCPMPAIGIANVDSLRQFYGTSAPKFRVLTGNK